MSVATLGTGQLAQSIPIPTSQVTVQSSLMQLDQMEMEVALVLPVFTGTVRSGPVKSTVVPSRMQCRLMLCPAVVVLVVTSGTETDAS